VSAPAAAAEKDPRVLAELTEQESAVFGLLVQNITIGKINVYDAQIALEEARRRVREAQQMLQKAESALQTAVSFAGSSRGLPGAFGLGAELKTLERR